MPVSLITGVAGTGKTTRLMAIANEHSNALGEHQHILALTRMHGSRRRLEAKLRLQGLYERSTITTIDAFALSMVNRWRDSLGHSVPLVAVPSSSATVATELGIEVSFDTILDLALRLLQSRTIRRVIGSSYPVVIVDEFQDCTDAWLKFVSALSNSCTLLLGADHFQDLNGSGSCPAVEWVEQLDTAQMAEIEDLTRCHRTSSEDLLTAARCLRDNISSDTATVPVVCCPNAGPAAWKIIEKLVCSSASQRWRGNAALICPGHDRLVERVLVSCESQLARRNRKPIRWHVELSSEQERKALFETLKLSGDPHGAVESWDQTGWEHDPTASHVVDRVLRFVKLRGLDHTPTSVVAKYAERVLHERRSYGAVAPSRVVTTVHGAKNREFDNVFVLWTYKLPPDVEVQRRWLYNAITRSKQNCMVLVLGNETRAANDPVLSLLGPPVAAFPAKKRGKARNSRSRKTSKK